MDVKLAKRVIEECFPQIKIQSLTSILEGWDNFVFEINGDFIFRFPKRPDTEAQLEKEILLLPELARALSVRVPRFEFVWRGKEGYDKPFVGYRKIDGVPLSECLKLTQPVPLAQKLSEFLSELHRFPVQKAAQLMVPDACPVLWRKEYQDLYKRVREQVFPLLEEPVRARAVALWENFLAHEENFRFKPVLIHRDLTEEHILCDPTRGIITGIIDWGDASIGDPALDFTGLLCDCGPDFTKRVLACYQGEVDETFWQRAVFYSKIIPFHQILFGLFISDEAHIKHGPKDLQLILSSGIQG